MDYSLRTWEHIRKHGKKVPFHMTFPLYESSDAEKEYERDYMKMARYLPKEAVALMPFIEEECDKMEYEGSMMYDESPDREHFRLVCRRIAANVEKARESDTDGVLRIAALDSGRQRLLETLLVGEMYRRRCRHKRCCRWW